MLQKLFKSRTTVGLLSLLLFSRPLHLREIARRIKVTPIYVKKELECLQGLGIVSCKRVGNLSVWEINKLSPIHADIKSLFLKTDALGGYLGEMFRGSEVEFALIYGSFASGKEGEKSDIDLFVVGKIDQRKFVQLVTKAEEKTSREINYVAWTRGEFLKGAKTRHHLLLNIAKNPIIMLKGDENEFRRTVG